jgi:hypothetical protein
MTKLTKLVAALILATGVSLQAQTITGFGSGDFLINDSNSSFDIGTSPVQTSSATTFSGVDGGTGFYISLNTPVALVSGFAAKPLKLTATLNVANSNGFAIELFDINGVSAAYSGYWSSFVTGASTEVTLTYDSTSPGFTGTVIAVLLGTGGTGQTLNVTLDNLAVVVPVPEPSTYAALSGIAVLGFVAYRRRRSAA